jgi:superoxide reductase
MNHQLCRRSGKEIEMDTSMKCEEDLLCGVNRVSDAAHMTDIEREHLPIIKAPKRIQANEPFDVQVEVGEQISHPNEPSHYIDFIDLYADDTFIARLDLTPKMTSPIMKVRVSLGHAHESLRAFAHCNTSGTWEGCMQIEVA